MNMSSLFGGPKDQMDNKLKAPAGTSPLDQKAPAPALSMQAQAQPAALPPGQYTPGPGLPQKSMGSEMAMKFLSAMFGG